MRSISGNNPQAYGLHLTLIAQRRATSESLGDLKRRTGYVPSGLLQCFSGQAICLQVVASGFGDTLGPGRPTPAQLALARALVLPLLLLNEPGQDLDTAQQPHFRAVLEASGAVSQATLLYLSQYAEDIQAA